MKITETRKTNLIVPSGFGGYDLCMNPYVGCQFGCKYCYVRFFIKDTEEPWGKFLRTRNFIKDKLPKEIHKLNGMKLVLGTMTDPYQPQERKHRLTRQTLEIIEQQGNPAEIGIFTRSPFILDDLDLLKRLNVRIHLTITPFDHDILRKIEPIPIPTKNRFTLARKLVDAGLRCHISISPILPILSDSYRKEFIDNIIDIKPSGFTIDPMQCYGPAFQAVDTALGNDPRWLACRVILVDKKGYADWKLENKTAWENEWAAYRESGIFAIIMDHQSKERFSLSTGGKFNFLNFIYP
jgi:DNA repair photolyase